MITYKTNVKWFNATYDPDEILRLSTKEVIWLFLEEEQSIGHSGKPQYSGQRQADLYEFEASLVYIVRPRSATATQ